MKKLLYLIPLLLCTYVHADTQTSGSMKLLKPTTGYVDTRRSWADKINANFDIIDSTVSNTLNQVRNPVIFSTNIANGQVWGEDIAVGTIASSHVVAGTFLNNGVAVVRSSHTLGLLQNSVGVVFSSHIANGQFLQNGTEVVFSSHVKTGTFIKEISIYDSGFQGNVNTIDFGANLTATVVGTTATIAGSAGGGGGSAIATSTRVYQLGSGSQLFKATATFAGTGLMYTAFQSTIALLSAQCWLGESSTTGATMARFAYSTAALNSQVWSYVTPQIVIDTNTRVSGTYSFYANTKLNAGEMLAVHTTTIPALGKLPPCFGCSFTGWRLDDAK